MKNILLAGTALTLAACSQPADSNIGSEQPAADTEAQTQTSDADQMVNPEIWPDQQSAIGRDEAIEARIADILSQMTVEEKVGQVIQADIASVTPEEVREYNLGSVLNGGSSAPNNDNYSPPEDWLALADEFWLASTDTADGGVGIPAIWGTDAVHGHSNIVGATLFPHNIGLGAMRDPAIMEEIGEITAREMLVTGLDWTFAPTVAVVRNDRWGRTYESYSEDPAIVAEYAPRIVIGIQGQPGTDDFLSDEHMISTTKHFLGDGGTEDGVDQGSNLASEEDLRDIHAAGYPAAIAEAGIQTVMPSFNDWHGRKMHGYKELLTDVLVDRMGFDGFTVGDWNGHGQVAGCTNISCATAFNAGLDMFMAPDSWKGLYENTLAQVEDGTISMERLDEAVSRILRVKLRAGVFEAGLPSERPYAGQWELLGSAEHREVARRAVRQSLVLLKNNDGTLPLDPSLNILMAGDGADNIGKQSGGWTINWQGTDNENSDFPGGTSIYDGIAAAAEAAGGSVTLSEDGSFDDKPDVAIVVFGEDPYAEFQGDRANLDFTDDGPLETMRALQAEGIPVVSVFLSGRPMFTSPEINASDAFVAAWLPGSEGVGVADVLMAKVDGSVNHDFTGTLSFSWPKTAVDDVLNVGDADYDPLFAYGYGLTYGDEETIGDLSEDSGLGDAALVSLNTLIVAGNANSPWRMVITDGEGENQISGSTGETPSGSLSVVPADYEAQEDTSIVTWTAPARFYISGQPVDLTRQTNGDMVVEFTYQVTGDATGSTSLFTECGTDCGATLDVSGQVADLAGAGWQTSQVKLSCFAEAGLDVSKVTVPFGISSEGPLTVQIQSAEIVSNGGDADCNL
ncbi:glycoside hydrolase family 3 protein [Aquisalinus flavus]|uniref:glycoside hydrolase family 3 protein n=1 Tax=Aquisalinus flavus TaxID=1526572 RepID=UPI0019D6E567|nr:exo 1,3/1,4-beta-D-glucan glucohydrolase [Aquisalinus flavus]